jgi:hypothetical protein
MRVGVFYFPTDYATYLTPTLSPRKRAEREGCVT